MIGIPKMQQLMQHHLLNTSLIRLQQLQVQPNRAARCSTATPDAFHISDFNFRPCYMIFFHQRIYSIHNFRKFLLRLRLQPSQIFRLQHIGIQLRGGKQNGILRNRNPLFAAFQSEPIGLAEVIHRFPVIQARIGNLIPNLLNLCQMGNNPERLGLHKFINHRKGHLLPRRNNHLAMLIHTQVDILHVFARQFVFNFNPFILHRMHRHGYSPSSQNFLSILHFRKKIVYLLCIKITELCEVPLFLIFRFIPLYGSEFP